jgi:hypothetical protein
MLPGSPARYSLKLMAENCRVECGKSLLRILCGAVTLNNVFATSKRRGQPQLTS